MVLVHYSALKKKEKKEPVYSSFTVHYVIQPVGTMYSIPVNYCFKLDVE